MPDKDAEPQTAGKGVTASLVRAGQIASALTALAGVSVLIWNAVKPAPSPAVLEAKVSRVQARYGVTLSSYLTDNPIQLAQTLSLYRADHLSDDEIKEELKQPGILAEYTIGLHGPPGQEVTLVRTLFNAVTEAKIAEGTEIGFGSRRYVAHAGQYQTTHSGWIAPPNTGGEFFVQVSLVDKHGETLANNKSKAFRIPTPTH